VLTTPNLVSSSDTVGELTTRWFAGTTSGGLCIPDTTKTYTSSSPGSLTVGTKYTPGGSGDPCGYYVYYTWAGTHGNVQFNVYTGLPTSVGDCLTIVTSPFGTVAKIAKPAKGYKVADTVTLAPSTATTAYSCSHFFTAPFETIVGLPSSALDNPSELKANYYLGTLSGKKCSAPTLTTGTPAGMIMPGVAYKTSKTACGYYVIYTWTGAHGALAFQI